jgi:acyl-CoA thioester hydrolase
MARVKIKFPNEKPLFTTSIDVRIGDINYGNHLGNDSVLSIIHEARMRMLTTWGGTELDIAGTSLIMADVMIAYKGEAFYGEVLDVVIHVDECDGPAFDLLYHIKTTRNDKVVDIAHAKTGMICFDYNMRKITAMTDAMKSLLKN